MGRRLARTLYLATVCSFAITGCQSPKGAVPTTSDHRGTLAAVAGLVIVFDLSLHPRWATTLAVYHAVQFVAFGLVFLSVPAVLAEKR